MEQIQITNDYSTQTKQLNYLIDPTFTNIIRLFVLSFARNILGEKETLFHTIYVPNIEIKDFNVLIDGSFFDLAVKNEEDTYEKMIKMSNNNDDTTGNLLDFAHFKENCRLIAADLSKQTKLKNS